MVRINEKSLMTKNKINKLNVFKTRHHNLKINVFTFFTWWRIFVSLLKNLLSPPFPVVFFFLYFRLYDLNSTLRVKHMFQRQLESGLFTFPRSNFDQSAKHAQYGSIVQLRMDSKT